MPRTKLVDRPIEKTISIPKSIHDRIELELFSPLLGKVPHGKWSELVNGLLREYLKSQSEGEGQ